MVNILLFFLLLLCSANALAINKEKTKKHAATAIVLPLNNWASQRIITKAFGQLLIDHGLTVEYKNISSNDQWGALRQGLVHVQLEVWQASMAKDLQRMLKQGFVIEMGTHSATGKEDWWYPKHVAQYCPELPNWQALNKCAPLFATTRSNGKGVYHAGPWDYGDGDIIRALDLNFVIERHATDKHLWKALNNAVAKQQPIMLLNWTPNWTDISNQGHFVKFPAYSKACEQDASWGLNKKLIKDCANPTNGWIKKVAWSGFSYQWPCVSKLVRKLNLTKPMLADASHYLVAEKLTENAAVKKWQAKYHQQLQSWLPNDCPLSSAS